MEVAFVVVVLLVALVVIGGRSEPSGGATTSAISTPPHAAASPPAPQHIWRETTDEAFVTGYVIGRHFGDRRDQVDQQRFEDRYGFGLGDDDWCHEDDWME
jgi:hypothetical protein